MTDDSGMEGVTDVQEIVAFLEANVDGKTLFTKELLYELENGALQGVYSDQISFSNLKYSQSGLQMDMFIVSNEKIWLIGKGGQRDTLRKDMSGVSLFRFELARRKSTGDITGCFRFISASGKNVAAEAIVSGIYDVRLENNALLLSKTRFCTGISQFATTVTSPLPFKRRIGFIARTKSCTMNTTANALTWTPGRCGAVPGSTRFRRLYPSRNRRLPIKKETFSRASLLV